MVRASDTEVWASGVKGVSKDIAVHSTGFRWSRRCCFCLSEPSCKTFCFLGGAGDSGGNGNGAPVGRGAMRGRRQVNVESVRTRPATLNSKKGELHFKHRLYSDIILGICSLKANSHSMVASVNESEGLLLCFFKYIVLIHVCLEGPVLLRHMSCDYIVFGLTTGWHYCRQNFFIRCSVERSRMFWV